MAEQQLRHHIVPEEYRRASLQGLSETIRDIDQRPVNTDSSNSSAVSSQSHHTAPVDGDEESLDNLEAAEVMSQLDDLEAEMMSQLEDSDLEFDDEDLLDNDDFVEVGALHLESPERDVVSPDDDRKTPVLDTPLPADEATPTIVQTTPTSMNGINIVNGHSNDPSNGMSDRWSLVKEERMKRKSLV